MNGISEINWRCVGWAARSRGQYNSGSPFSSLFFFNSFLWEWKELIEEKEELTGSAAGSVIWRNLIELVKSNWIQWSCRVELDEMDWGCCFWVGYGPATRPMAPPKEANQPSQSINSNSTKQFIKSEVKINQLEFLFFAAVDEINKAKERNGLIDWTSGAPSSPAARQANNSTNQMLAFQLGPHLMVVLAELLFLSSSIEEWDWVGYGPEAPLPRTIPFQQFLNCFHFSCLLILLKNEREDERAGMSWLMKDKLIDFFLINEATREVD